MTTATGAQFFDLSDAASFGASSDGFLDGAHLDRNSGALLAEHLLRAAHLLKTANAVQ